MTTTAPPLPAGWLWLFDEGHKRWGFIHSDTEHKQAQFPNVGDELASVKAKDTPPAYSTLEASSTISSTSVVAIHNTRVVEEAAHLTANVATAIVEQPLRPSRNAVRNFRRKPIENDPASHTVYPIVPTTATEHPVLFKVVPSKQATHNNANEFAAELPAAEVVRFEQEAPLRSVIPITRMTSTIRRPVPNAREPTAPLQTPYEQALLPTPLVASSGMQELAPLVPAQTAPAAQPIPELHRPQLATIQSAPQVLQADELHNPEAPRTAEPKKSRLSRMSKGMGDWAKKHPKMAIGSAVMVEIAGLAAGVDVAKDAKAIQTMTQTVKRVTTVKPTPALPAAGAAAARPGQTHQSPLSQAQIQQLINQSAQQQTQQLLQQVLQQQQAAQGQPALQSHPQQNAQGHVQHAHVGLQSHPFPNDLASPTNGSFHPHHGTLSGPALPHQQTPGQQPAQMPQGPLKPTGTSGSPHWNNPQSPVAQQQQQQPLAQQTVQLSQSPLSPVYQATPPPQQLPQQQNDPQTSNGKLNNIVNKASQAYENHQANQAAQQQQFAYQQELAAYQQQPQQSGGLGDSASNLVNAYQNNQANQQQNTLQQQIVQQQINCIQQQSADQQQIYQAQMAQLSQQSALYQNPYVVQQQPVYIDNSSGDSGGLANALALATILDPSSGTSQTAVSSTTVVDPAAFGTSSMVDTSAGGLYVDPTLDQTMEQEAIMEENSEAWTTSIDDADIL